MRSLRVVIVAATFGLVAATMAVGPAEARGGGAHGGGFRIGIRSPGFAYSGARSPLFRLRSFGRPFVGHPFFGRPYAALAPYGYGYGFGFGGIGYGGGGYNDPGLPIDDVPPYRGPVYGQRDPAAEPTRSPIEQAALVAPAIPGVERPAIPTVTTPYEVRPGTLAARDVAGLSNLPTVIAGR